MISRSFSWLVEHSRPLLTSGNNVTVLSTPGEYLQWLKSQLVSVKWRIHLSSLYLGTGDLEKELVRLIANSLQANPSLQCSIVLDSLRGHRGNPNSVSVLGTLIQEFPHQFSLYMYHTPSLRGFLKWALPQRINEVVGLQHTKLHVFDDNVLMTGANLSHDYFTNRQDRYISFDSAPSLANYFSKVHESLSRHSFLVKPDSTLAKPAAMGGLDPLQSRKNSNIFKKSFYEEMQTIILSKTHATKTHSHTAETHSHTVESHSHHTTKTHANTNTESCITSETRSHTPGTDYESIGMESEEFDTVVYPLVQMGEYGMRQDEVVTAGLLSNASPNERLCIASGYFNLPDVHKRALLDSKGHVSILASSPQCMGFYGAKGPAGSIPQLYSNLAAQFLRYSSSHGSKIRYYEYYKQDWTYHAKGLWYYLEGMTLPSLTLIGSSNYGYRSLKRDLECQVAIVTRNKRLQLALDNERERLYNHGTLLSLEDMKASRDHRPSLWVKGITPLLKYYV